MKHPFLHRSRVIVALSVGVLLLLPTVLYRPNYGKYLAVTQWETDGAFVANGQLNPRDFPHAFCDDDGAQEVAVSLEAAGNRVRQRLEEILGERQRWPNSP